MSSNLFADLLSLMIRVFIPLFGLFIIITIIKIIMDYSKYGKKIFSSFKNYDRQGKMRDIVIEMVKNESPKEVSIILRDDNSFYTITDYDIIGVLIIEADATLSGTSKDASLRIEKGLIKQFISPIPKFISDINKLKENNIPIRLAIVKANKNCELKISDIDSRNIYTLKDFCFKLYRIQHSDSRYTKKDMNHYHKKIEELTNGNNQD